MPANMAIWGFWVRVNGQWRIGFNGRVALDWPAVFQMAEFFGTELTWNDYHKLAALEAETLRRDREAQKRE